MVDFYKPEIMTNINNNIDMNNNININNNINNNNIVMYSTDHVRFEVPKSEEDTEEMTELLLMLEY